MSLICLLNAIELFGQFLKSLVFYFIGMAHNFLLALALCTHTIQGHSKRLNGPEKNIYTWWMGSQMNGKLISSNSTAPKQNLTESSFFKISTSNLELNSFRCMALVFMQFWCRVILPSAFFTQRSNLSLRFKAFKTYDSLSWTFNLRSMLKKWLMGNKLITISFNLVS